MKTYTFRIWDKVSPINGCPADVAVQSLRLRDDDEVYIISVDGKDSILQTGRDCPYPRGTIEEAAQAHTDAMVAEEQEQETTDGIVDILLGLE